MNLGELFDGKLHYMDPEEDFQEAWQEQIDYIEVAIQPKDLDPLETPDIRMVSVESSNATQAYWSVERGWSACSTLAQSLGEALGGMVIAVQLNHRVAGVGRAGELEASFGPPVEQEFTVKYRPGNFGWVGVL